MSSPAIYQSTIYADHAATTALSPLAYDAMKPFMTDHYANASQPYAISRPCRQALQEARERIAACINANPEEIFFTSGGTESDNWALKASITPERNHLITSQIEHHAILRTAAWLKQWGCRISLLPVDRAGFIYAERLPHLLNKRTALVSVMLANNEVGTMQDLWSICQMVHAHGVPVHTDAVQAVGHVPVDVHTLGVDLLSASAHKFNGPKGIGFLYKRLGLELPPLLHGGSQETGLRAGTENVAAIVGMAVALEEQCRHLSDYAAKMAHLEDLFLEELSRREIVFRSQGPDLTLPHTRARRLPGLLSLSFPGHSGESLLHLLDLRGVCVSTGSACDSRNTKMSHVLKALHIPKSEALGTIRISLGYENTPDDVMTIVEMLEKCLQTTA